MSDRQYYSISDINRYISFKFEQDINLQDVYLQGEISNFKYSGKHCYFSLKDEFSEISAMFFYPSNLSLKFKPIDGMSVQVCGKIQIYQKKGTYAIIVDKMAETGIGLLYQEFLDLKEKLAKEGLFDESKKLKLPEYPEKVAIITASTGEAIKDIISTFNRRFPLAKLKLYPALVQGIDAPKDLVRALKEVYKDNDADVIIIGRGGGSFEDLSCFNDEMLARTLFSSTIPTISAVGHEGDFTICDFVASFRAPTPTGAAMQLTKDKNDVLNTLMTYSKRLSNGMKNKLITSFNIWKTLSGSYALNNFDKMILTKEENLNLILEKLSKYSPDMITKTVENELNELNLRIKNSIKHVIINQENEYEVYKNRLRKKLITDRIDNYFKDIEKYSNNLSINIHKKYDMSYKDLTNLTDKIVLLNPFNIMNKGYSIVYKNGEIITSSKKLIKNDKIKIKMADGDAIATIE